LGVGYCREGGLLGEKCFEGLPRGVRGDALSCRGHPYMFRRIGDYTADVVFHHAHIPIPLSRVDQVTDKAMDTIKAYANNVYQKSMRHYHEDNQCSDTRKAQGYAKIITDQNLFVIKKSEKSVKHLQKYFYSLGTALPNPSTRISKRQIGLIFGFMGTSFSAINAEQILNL
jgi:hypothetical protein